MGHGEELGYTPVLKEGVAGALLLPNDLALFSPLRQS